jgi:hypothetical protein
MAQEKPKLVPARPEVDESASYMPRIPWRLVLLGMLSLATVMGGYAWKEKRKADALRAAILQVHDGQLGEARDAYMALRGKIEALVLDAAQKPLAPYVDPRLHIPGLRAGNGLYLRLRVNDAKTKAGIAKGAKVMDSDLIATCMGLSPASVRGLYEKGEFLTPEWAKETAQLRDVMHLRVQDEMLSRHIKADLPSVLGLVRADWLMLVLQEGPNRKVAPVDVFLWDLKRSEPLLRARVQAEGVLLTARIQSKDQPYSPKLAEQGAGSGGANDCSIASQLKALEHVKAEEPKSAEPVAPAVP